MIRILICIDDARTQDIVRTAFRQFTTISCNPVPRDRLLELISEHDYHGVVLDFVDRTEQTAEMIRSIRGTDANIEILTLVDRQQKDRLNRDKMELGIFSYLPYPIDAFELARKILRLEKHFVERNPLAS